MILDEMLDAFDHLLISLANSLIFSKVNVGFLDAFDQCFKDLQELSPMLLNRNSFA